VSKWLLELAFGEDEKPQKNILLKVINILCELRPEFYVSLGRARKVLML
jgi:hypothetical protein